MAGSGGRIKATRFLPGKLDVHYKEHVLSGEFGEDMTSEEYEEKARKFFDNPITKDLLWFDDVDGVLYKHDKKKNEFGICGPNGIIITYFKPDRGTAYWHDEVIKHYGTKGM